MLKYTQSKRSPSEVAGTVSKKRRVRQNGGILLETNINDCWNWTPQVVISKLTTSHMMASKASCTATGQHVFNNNMQLQGFLESETSRCTVPDENDSNTRPTTSTMVINFNLVWISMHFVLVVLEIMLNTNANFL